MSQGPPARKPLPALRLFEASDADHTGVQERLGFSTEESTMITSLERLEGVDTTGVTPVDEGSDELSAPSPSELSTASGDLPASALVNPPALGPSAVDSFSMTLPVDSPPNLTPPSLPTGVFAPPMFSSAEELSPHEGLQVSQAEQEAVLPMSFEEQHRLTDELPHEAEELNATPTPTPAPASVASALSVQAQAGGQQRGIMMTSFNARGGVGCTSLLLSLAGALQCRGFKVVIVDMDLQLATLSSSLDVKLERSLAELVMEAQATAGPIRSAFDHHKSGVAVVAQEERISEISNVTPERLPRLFSALRQSFDVILVDGLRNFSDIAVAVMDDSDMVLLPVTQDIPAVRSARKVLKLFARLGYEGGKSRVILNRFHKRSLVTEEVIEEHLRCVISERLPNDFAFVSQGLTEGELLHLLNPKHPFCLAVDRLTAQLMGFPAPVQKQGLLSRLFGR